MWALNSRVAPPDGCMADVYDTPLWKRFTSDPQMKEASLPIALTACTDGASPFKRRAYSFWPVAVECLSLPPWVRHTLFASHLLMLIPGPYKPKDFQPFLEIFVDELIHLYW